MVGGFSAFDEPAGRCGSGCRVNWGRRLPRTLPAARRLDTLSVIRSQLILSSIWAKAAMTVKTMLPMGVPVSTFLPPSPECAAATHRLVQWFSLKCQNFWIG
jgi:hypothetical protein